MTTFPAYWVAPGSEPLVRASAMDTVSVTDDFRLEYPSPTAQLAHGLCDELDEASLALHERDTASLVRALGDAGERFLDPEDPLRREALEFLPAASGFSAPMAEVVLDHMARDWTADGLTELIKSEFPDTGVLEGFRPGAGTTRVRAMGHGLVLQVGAGNVPGVSVGGVTRALLLRSAVLLKTGLHDAVLPVLFARALAERDPGLSAALTVVYWPGGSEAAEAEALTRAGLVVVYGGTDTVSSIRARLPATAGLIAYPHRVSVALVGREALATTAAEGTAEMGARAVATFDQRGCVSPHAFWVEEGGDVGPAAWAELLGRGMSTIETELPSGAPTAATASAIHQLRGAWELKEASGSGVRVFRSPSTEWTVVYDPDQAFAPSCLGRFVWVKPVRDLGQAPGIARAIGPHLQTVGLCGAGERTGELVERLGRAGASRVTTLEGMAWPPPWWHHDGTGPLHALSRWVDWEVG